MKNRKIGMTLVLLFALSLLCFSALAEPAAVDMTAAQSIALTHAGVALTDVKSLTISVDFETGTQVYDVDFTAGDLEYEYHISTTDGSVVKRSCELTDAGMHAKRLARPETYMPVGEAAALAAALADAGVIETDVLYAEVWQTTEDGLDVYEVLFYTESDKYEYDIDVADSAVLSVSAEIRLPGVPLPVMPSQQNTSGAGTVPGIVTAATSLSLAEAKTIALNDAGVSSATFTKAELDTDDGVRIYDIEFYTDTHEYDYEINAVSGTVRERSSEADRAQPASATDSGAAYIGIDRAKAIALNHAGVSGSEVRFSKAKLENDDGVKVYEIEFRKGNAEYEYEIHAVSGAVLDYSIDYDDRDDDSPSGNDRDDDRDDDDDDDWGDDDDDDDDDDWDDDDD